MVPVTYILADTLVLVLSLLRLWRAYTASLLLVRTENISTILIRHGTFLNHSLTNDITYTTLMTLYILGILHFACVFRSLS